MVVDWDLGVLDLDFAVLDQGLGGLDLAENQVGLVGLVESLCRVEPISVPREGFNLNVIILASMLVLLGLLVF